MSPFYNVIELVKTASPREGFYLDAAACTRIELVPLAWQASIVATRLTGHKQDAFVYTCALPTELINQLMAVDIGIEPMTSSSLNQTLLNSVLYILTFNY